MTVGGQVGVADSLAHALKEWHQHRHNLFVDLRESIKTSWMSRYPCIKAMASVDIHISWDISKSKHKACWSPACETTRFSSFGPQCLQSTFTSRFSTYHFCFCLFNGTLVAFLCLNSRLITVRLSPNIWKQFIFFVIVWIRNWGTLKCNYTWISLN